jgi:hypothetical protein
MNYDHSLSAIVCQKLMALQCYAGLEKTRFFFKPSPVGFFGFLGFFGVFLPRREGLWVFLQFQEYF